MDELISKKEIRSPLISVLLPVYNGAEYIEDAIQSILWQTYNDFELIIINDGSYDASGSVIQNYKDPRIRYYEQSNQGLAATLNRAVSLARGEYLARQDHDDISLPKRFEKQVAFLKSHPSHGLVGTWAAILEDVGEIKGVHRHPVENSVLKYELLFDNPFVHSSVMIRKTVFDKIGAYTTDKSRQPPEDYELWSRVSREFDVANIPEILLIYREIPTSMSRAGLNPFLDRVINLSAENIAWVIGRESPDQNIIDLVSFVHGASHRLSSKPHITEIMQVLNEAVNKLCDKAGPKCIIIKNKALKRLYSIRHSYLEYRYGKIVGKLLMFLYKMLKRIGD